MKVYKFKGMSPNIHPESYIFDDVVIIGDVVIEKNVSIWPGVTIRGDKAPIIIREGSNIQEHAVLHADPGYPLVVEKNVTIGHGVLLHGCVIGENSVIGIGASLLNGSSVPTNSMVTAGSMLSAGPKFEANSMISGSPGKKLMSLSESDIQHLKYTALEYQELSVDYQNHLEKI